MVITNKCFARREREREWCTKTWNMRCKPSPKSVSEMVMQKNTCEMYRKLAKMGANTCPNTGNKKWKRVPEKQATTIMQKLLPDIIRFHPPSSNPSFIFGSADGLRGNGVSRLIPKLSWRALHPKGFGGKNIKIRAMSGEGSHVSGVGADFGAIGKTRFFRSTGLA